MISLGCEYPGLARKQEYSRHPEMTSTSTDLMGIYKEKEVDWLRNK